MSVTSAAILPVAAHLELVAVEVAAIAAEYVRTQRAGATELRTKSTPTDVVTATDLASERLIRDELARRCPGSSILGEEYDETVGANTIRWIVDPIDGTVNFLYRLPVVSVSVAAALDGKVVAGAVTDVLNGSTWSAHAGAGARRDGAPIAVSQPSRLAESLIGTGFAYEAEVRREQAAVLNQLLPACRDIRCMGSAALNLCWVGEGLLDGYFERNIKIYDYAAGALIAAEAGAIVNTPADGEPGLSSAIAPAIEAELLEIIDE
ncbi:MAG: inositol monophosphatase family protein [Actinomycetota bacterium]